MTLKLGIFLIFFLNISDIEAFVSHLTKLILEEGCRYFCENECQSSIPITGSELKGCFRLIWSVF